MHAYVHRVCVPTMPSLPSLPAALNLAQFSVCHLVPVTGRMTGVLKGFNYPRTQIMIAYLWAHVLEENRICALCIRALHFLCLLLEPEKWLREIHAHFPAIPTHGGEAESVGEDFQYLWYFDTPGSEWWGGGSGEREEKGSGKHRGLHPRQSRARHFSFKADGFHFWRARVGAGGRVR